jgi:two-component system chemotaxis response regulator CheY
MAESFRVLAVDSSEFARKVVAASLADSEFELVDCVGGGQDAVTRFGELEPDLVLLDIVLPQQNGLEALKQILSLQPEARVVMVSSLGTDDAVTECLRAGAKLFIQKPFEKGDLLAALRHALTA